jgi:hypothetical protein
MLKECWRSGEVKLMLGDASAGNLIVSVGSEDGLVMRVLHQAILYSVAVTLTHKLFNK